MGGGRDDGPTGPVLPPEGGHLDAEQGQGGERVPEVHGESRNDTGASSSSTRLSSCAACYVGVVLLPRF